MHLRRVMVIFVVIAALVSFPILVQAQPLPAQLEIARTDAILPSTEDFLARSSHKILSKDYQGAILDLDQAIQENPRDARAHMNHGLIRGVLGDKQGALLDFNQALQINPSLAEAYYNRGFIRAELQDYLGAVADFDQSLRIKPKDAETCHCRGMVRYKLGDQQGAIADFELAANLYLKQGRADAHQGLLEQISKLEVYPALPLL